MAPTDRALDCQDAVRAVMLQAGPCFPGRVTRSLQSAPPAAPNYGTASLSEVLPSVLASLGVPGDRDVLGLGEAARTVVLLVDGLGENLLRLHADAAPFLAGLAGRPLTAGFPSTTVSSLTSLGTGLPTGLHGLTGATSYVAHLRQTVNWLAWRPVGSDTDLRPQLDPEDVQPTPTALERAAANGIAVTTVTSAKFEGSGLTRAALRGGRFAGSVSWGDTVALTAEALQRGHRSLVYCYAAELDLTGHVRGCTSGAWRAELALVDQLARAVAQRLPDDARLLVTGDHGMVDVPQDGRVDVESTPGLLDGVAGIGGEPRVRYVHCRPGAAADVLAAWQAALGERMWVATAQQAVDAGLFGPQVTPAARSRIGDVVAIATTPDVAVVRRRTESVLSSLRGQHGALSDDELLVPLLTTG